MNSINILIRAFESGSYETGEVYSRNADNTVKELHNFFGYENHKPVKQKKFWNDEWKNF
jgi:hypothetical protein